MDTGYTAVQDKRGVPHRVYISVTRSGSVWIRAGVDYKSQDWIFVDEENVKYETALLDQDTLSLLKSLDYMDYCVLTDMELVIRAESGWHPSFLIAYDPKKKDDYIIHFRNEEDCMMRTNLTLAPNKQGIVCDGGRVNSCGVRYLPTKGRPSRTFFIMRLAMDPKGKDYLACDSVVDRRNMYTFTGSFYHIYVKVAECPTPKDSRVLGHEAKLRAYPHNDVTSNTVVIPDPLQGALNDGVIRGWQVFVKVISIQHEVFLQVWRPVMNDPNMYSLVGQTFLEPPELRFQEVALDPRDYIHVQKGDVLGLYFPRQNPLAWSAVPCAFDLQAYKFIENPNKVSVGRTKIFSQALAGPLACRHYSVTAVFGNKTHAKLVEDWTCPTAELPAGMHRRSGAHRKPNGDGNSLGDGASPFTNKPSLSGLPQGKEKRPLDGAIPLHLILIIIGCLILLLIIVGFISYYRAINS